MISFGLRRPIAALTLYTVIGSLGGAPQGVLQGSSRGCPPGGPPGGSRGHLRGGPWEILQGILRGKKLVVVGSHRFSIKAEPEGRRGTVDQD